MDYNLLKKQIKFNGFRIKDIAQEIGITEQGLHGMIKNDTLKVRDLEKICKVIGVDMNIFFGGSTFVKNEVSEGSSNIQSVNSSLKNVSVGSSKNEIGELKAKIKDLEVQIELKDKEILELSKNLNECRKDKEMYRKIIESKI